MRILLSALAASLAAQPLARAQSDTVPDPISLVLEARDDYRGGRLEQALAKMERGVALLPGSPGPVWYAALANARLGRHEQSLRWLHRVADFGVYYPIDTAGALAPVRSLPGFAPVRARFEQNLLHRGESAVAFVLPERDLIPESIAYDPRSGAFYIGSMYRRKIVVRATDGGVRDFVGEGRDGLWSVLGMKIDPERRELWANSCNLGSDTPMAIADSATVGRTGVFRYDLATGRLIARYLAGSDSAQVCFNDLTISRRGDVYVSAGAGGVWRIRAGGAAVEPLFRANRVDVNGIALAADEASLYLATGNLGVVRLHLATLQHRSLDIPAGSTLNGIDGLYVHRNSLVAVQNGYRPERVLQAELDASGDRVQRLHVLDAADPRFDVPTTGVIVGDTLFVVATSQLDSFDAAGRIMKEKLKENVILKVGLRRRD
jgi:hypothetical protein